MPAHHFVVSQDASHWKFSFHGTDHGPFMTREDAVNEAIASAKEQVADGIEAEVLVQDVDMTFQTAWKNGNAASA